MTHEQFERAYKNNDPLPPIIIDENSCLDILTRITGKHLTTLDECRTGEFQNISLYEIPEDRKLFDITTVRNCIRDMSLVPYEEKHIYILRSIDTGTPEAMNALLKILEECPIYASIMLVVEDSEALLETIHSRCMNLHINSLIGTISEELKSSFELYTRGNITEFTRELFTRKIEKSEAIALLRYAILHGAGKNIEKLEQGIIDIRMGHDTPRNILDSLFIIPR